VSKVAQAAHLLLPLALVLCRWELSRHWVAVVGEVVAAQPVGLEALVVVEMVLLLVQGERPAEAIRTQVEMETARRLILAQAVVAVLALVRLAATELQVQAVQAEPG
jgi:hypothetical protein